MAHIRADKVGKELCNAMGINPFNVSFLQITCEAGEAAKVRIERFVDSEEIGILKKIVSHYTFTEDKMANGIRDLP